MTTKRNSEYLNHVLSLVSDRGFQAEAAQIETKALLTEILKQIPSYQWTYIARRVVRNISAATFELEALATDDSANSVELEEASKRIASVWESLAKLGEAASVSGALLNAAINYELAGYQANAACIAKQIRESSRHSALPVLLDLTTMFLQRRFLALDTVASPLQIEPDHALISNEEYLELLGTGLAAKAFSDAAKFFLAGNESASVSSIDLLDAAAELYANLGHVDAHNLMRAMRCLMPVIQRRSTWTLLPRYAEGQPKWARYLKLLARGPGVNIVRSRSISELWPSQIVALDQGLLNSDTSKLIRMPTSAGKTRIAELAIVHTLVQNAGAKCVYLAPYRALASELEHTLSNLLSDLGFTISAITGTYELDDFEEMLFREADVLVTTPEKLDLLLRAEHDLLEPVKLFVLDEAQIVEDQSRGVKYELLVSRLKRHLPYARFLILSAVIPEQTLVDFADWFNISRQNDVSISLWRPSIQRYALFEWSGKTGILRYAREPRDTIIDQVVQGFVPGVIGQEEYAYTNPKTGHINHRKFPDPANKAQVAAELAFKFAELGPVLVFCTQRPFVEAVAKALKEKIDLLVLSGQPIPSYFQAGQSSTTLFADSSLMHETRSAILAQEWLGNRSITTWLRFGIGVHFGGLPDVIRSAVETDFRNKRLRVLIATNTLAQGVNFPVKTVIVHSCWRYIDGEQQRLPARDYWNIAGRAGRAGEETEGLIIHVKSRDNDEKDFRYYSLHKDEVEPVSSALFEDLQALTQKRLTEEGLEVKLDPEILALLAEEGPEGLDRAAIEDLLDHSLMSVQANRRGLVRTPITDVFENGGANIRARIVDAEYLNVFSTTGLSSTSCMLLLRHVRDNLVQVRQLLLSGTFEQRNELLELILPPCLSLDEMQPAKAYGGSYSDLLTRWVEGIEISDILQVSANEAESPEDLGRIIDDLFRYRLPWGLSAYVRIATSVLQAETSDLSVLAMYLPAAVKYGLPDPIACWAMAVGIPMRNIALQMAAAFRHETGTINYRDFLVWLGTLNSERLATEFGLSGPLLEDVTRAVLAASPNPYMRAYANLEEFLPREIEIQGVRYENRVVAARAVDEGDELALRRDYFNELDRNAIRILHNSREVGYVPRQVAQVLAPEIDTGAELKAIVTQIERKRIPVIRVQITQAGFDL